MTSILAMHTLEQEGSNIENTNIFRSRQSGWKNLSLYRADNDPTEIKMASATLLYTN